jgi:hypothetical protein
LAILCDAYTKEELENGEREVLKLHPALAPYKACVLPLVKKFHSEKANELFNNLSKHFMVDYDETASIGKRYRRADVIGTPFCITVDDETIKPDVPTSPNAGGIHDPYTGVHISFKHALSSILFTARLSEAYTGTKITLKRIELTNVKSYGNFNQGLADNGTATTTADADLWTGENNAITYTVAADELLNTEKYYTCNDTRVAPVAADGKRTTDLILLPQVIADDAKMVITYTIQSPDSIALEQVLDIPLKNVVTEWKWGYRYIYNIIIGLDTIYFEPYVAPWTDYTPDLNPAF